MESKVARATVNCEPLATPHSASARWRSHAFAGDRLSELSPPYVIDHIKPPACRWSTRQARRARFPAGGSYVAAWSSSDPMSRLSSCEVLRVRARTRWVHPDVGRSKTHQVSEKFCIQFGAK